MTYERSLGAIPRRPFVLTVLFDTCSLRVLRPLYVTRIAQSHARDVSGGRRVEESPHLWTAKPNIVSARKTRHELNRAFILLLKPVKEAGVTALGSLHRWRHKAYTRNPLHKTQETNSRAELCAFEFLRWWQFTRYMLVSKSNYASD